VALSFDSFYWIIRLTNIPIFASERASMRIIGAPMVLFILLASIFFEQKWHGKIRTTSEKTVAIAAITYMFIDLWSNLTIWRPGEIRLHYPVLLVNLSGNSIANHSDPQYTIIMITGLVITIFTAIFLLTMSIGVKRKQSM
jgi:multisubunit Na+/H+ antiporter MnhC subunit